MSWRVSHSYLQLQVRVKVKFTLEQVTRTQRGASTIWLYSFFNLGARWVWVVNATSRPLYPPGKTRYSLYRGLGGPQGRWGRVRKISPPTGIRFPDRQDRSESLYRLSYPGPLCSSHSDNKNPLPTPQKKKFTYVLIFVVTVNSDCLKTQH